MPSGRNSTSVCADIDKLANKNIVIIMVCLMIDRCEYDVYITELLF